MKNNNDVMEYIRKSCEERYKKPLPTQTPYYTQRDWDRAVGIGEVPEEYRYPKMRKRLAAAKIAELYTIILQEKTFDYPTQDDPMLSQAHLLSMCDDIRDNYKEWSADKSHRWIGYIQGVLTALKIITVDEHRDMTRDIIKNSE